MAGNKRPFFTKRQKELARQERQRVKAEKRAGRKPKEKDESVPSLGIDPDIAGIEPGPQPLPWDELGNTVEE